MAIDRNKTKQFIEEVELLVKESIPEKYRKTAMDILLGPALNELKQLIDESRPPVFYLVGRSGHGKSSLINALANKKVSEIGDIRPTTSKSLDYLITFPEQHATWRIIDSRGLFETTPPEGEVAVNIVEMVKNDMQKFNPDIILHVISAPEIRNLAHDFEVFEEIMKIAKSEWGIEIPVVTVMTKCDTLGNPREWPPESKPRKAGLILEALEYMAKEVYKAEYEFYNKNMPYKGFLLKNSSSLAVIPVVTLWEEKWNIETLTDLISNYLPENTILDFIQAQKRKELLKKISSSLIKKFSAIASGIGAIPIPISDIFVLAPLQILLIAIIGGLSCKPVSKETASEYLTASGLSIGMGMGLRAVARQLVKLIPIAGSVISGGIAYTGTYMIGKAAEAYFFEGEIKKPEDFKKEAEGARKNYN